MAYRERRREKLRSEEGVDGLERKEKRSREVREELTA